MCQRKTGDDAQRILGPSGKGIAPTLATGRKWTPTAAVLDAKSALQHQHIVGHVQQGRGGFGLGKMKPTWQEANPTQMPAPGGGWGAPPRRSCQVCKSHIPRHARLLDEVGCGWEEKSHGLSFGTYDVLPSPTNLNLWLGEDPAFPLCSLLATLKHILLECKTSLTQGRYNWRHNQVLRYLAAELETKRVNTNAMPLKIQDKFPHTQSFVRQGEKKGASLLPRGSSTLQGARDWELVLTWTSDSYSQLRLQQPTHDPIWPSGQVPVSIPSSSSWLYLRRILWRRPLNARSCATLTWNLKLRKETGRLKCAQWRWGAETSATVVPQGSWGRLQSEEKAQRKAVKALYNTAERSSNWLWLKRKDPVWSPRWPRKPTMRHKPRSDQTVVGLPQLMVSYDERPKHLMTLRSTTVLYW